MLRLKLFGQFEILGAGAPIALSSHKLSAMLAYLAMAEKPVPRDEIATLLWGNHFDEQARQNVRQALVRLRKVIGTEALLSSEETLLLNPQMIAGDAREVEQLIRSGTTEGLESASRSLGSEFLAGIDVKEPVFEEWLLGERLRFQELLTDSLVHLASSKIGSGRADEGLRHAEACIARDYFREDAHRLAMQALAALGRRSEAVRRYLELAQRLKSELGTLPEADTVKLVDQLRGSGSLGAAGLSPSKKPSVAVMPFANLSNDPEQEYFADGVVEEIITALSRLHWLFVIARNSSFTYKHRAVDVRQVGRELGVRYILEGSLRKFGERVRIAGQLIDAESGATIWADRFEGELQDLFDLQDQITSHTVAAIAPRLEQAEMARSKHKPTDSLDAYDCYLRGLAGLNAWSRQGSEDALHYFKRAIALDPRFAAAYGLAARAISQRKAMNWMEDQAGEETEALYLCERAAEFGREDAVALGTAGFTLAFVAGRFADADALTERALKLNPNYAWGWFFSGFVKAVSGEPELAIERCSRALKLSPQDPLSYSMEVSIATAHFMAGRYAEALAQAEKASRMQPHRFSTLSLIAACSAHLGQQEKGRSAAVRLHELEPNLRLSNLHLRCHPMKRHEDFVRLKEGLRIAGLPE